MIVTGIHKLAKYLRIPQRQFSSSTESGVTSQVMSRFKKCDSILQDKFGFSSKVLLQPNFFEKLHYIHYKKDLLIEFHESLIDDEIKTRIEQAKQQQTSRKKIKKEILSDVSNSLEDLIEEVLLELAPELEDLPQLMVDFSSQEDHVNAMTLPNVLSIVEGLCNLHQQLVAMYALKQRDIQDDIELLLTVDVTEILHFLNNSSNLSDDSSTGQKVKISLSLLVEHIRQAIFLGENGSDKLDLSLIKQAHLIHTSIKALINSIPEKSPIKQVLQDVYSAFMWKLIGDRFENMLDIYSGGQSEKDLLAKNKSLRSCLPEIEAVWISPTLTHQAKIYSTLANYEVRKVLPDSLKKLQYPWISPYLFNQFQQQDIEKIKYESILNQEKVRYLDKLELTLTTYINKLKNNPEKRQELGLFCFQVMRTTENIDSRINDLAMFCRSLFYLNEDTWSYHSSEVVENINFPSWLAFLELKENTVLKMFPMSEKAFAESYTFADNSINTSLYGEVYVSWDCNKNRSKLIHQNNLKRRNSGASIIQAFKDWQDKEATEMFSRYADRRILQSNFNNPRQPAQPTQTNQAQRIQSNPNNPSQSTSQPHRNFTVYLVLIIVFLCCLAAAETWDIYRSRHKEKESSIE